MSRNIFKLIILILIISFFSFVFKYYFSEKNTNLVKKNRINLETKIRKNISNLPILTNDTNDVIEFNSGFANSNNKNFKRSFWELFK
mgnify:CR=1 FL=1